VSEYLAAIQGAIDRWDHKELGLVMLEAGVYIGWLKQILAPMVERDASGGTVAGIFRLSETLTHARGVDLATIRENKNTTGDVMDGVLADVMQLTALAWRDGIPQRAAGEAPNAPSRHEALLFEAKVLERARDLAHKLETHAPDQMANDPLIPDLEAQIDRRLAGPGHRRLTHADIPDQHILYEFLAHRFAYDTSLPLFGRAVARNGYSKEESYEFETRAGLSFSILMPRPDRLGELPPVVVFRGTQLDDLNDIRTDLEFQIGATHFTAVEELGLGEMLLGAANDAGGLLPHLTGHSLGGALAQLTAARWPERVGAVVTFQAPGLTRGAFKEAERRIARLPGGGPTVRHYIADHDLVHEAGQRHLTGETVLVTGLHVDKGEGWVWGLGHTDLLLSGHRMRERVVKLGLAAIWSPHTLSAFAMLPVHPTTLGSGLELARGGASLGMAFVKGMLIGPRDPASVVGRAREIVAKGLAQDEPSLRRGSLEIATNVALATQRELMRQVRKRITGVGVTP
jgi:hypothetical protein